MRWLIPLTLIAAGCQTAPVPDWSLFYDHHPTSILVLPVINESTAAEAPIAFSSTIMHPLVERGYYVFPIQPTLEILQANGVYEGGQLASVDPATFHEILGADAVLYVTLHSWDTNYAIIASSVEVSMTYQLVDARTGAVIWEDDEARVVTSDTSSSGNPLADLIGAAINAAVTAAATDYVPLARQANVGALSVLPPGPLREDHAEVRERLLAAHAAAAARAEPVETASKDG